MKLLIVDDEPKILNFLQKLLKQQKFNVDTCESGVMALEKLNSNIYDVIILDVRMPKQTGIQLCKKIRSQKVETPILMLSALDSTADKVDGLNSGADDYVTKPFRFEELLARVNSLMRRKRYPIVKQKKGEELKMKDLILDPIKYELRRGEESIHLTKKEFALIEYFMENRGRLITHEEIMNKIWRKKKLKSNTLTIYIRRVRKIIDKDSKDESFLSTVHGKGYKCE